MKTKRMAISIWLACLMLVQIFVPMQGAALETEGYERAVQVLSELEIVEGREDGDFDGTATLTRAEMATIIVRIMQMEDNEEETTVFEDVPEEHWAYYPITTAFRAGVVNGVNKTHFLPDTEVTGEQAVKMMVAFLGYTKKAESMGGYPAGYLLCAHELDMLKGVQETGKGNISRFDMARLVYNALETEMMLPEEYGEDARGYVMDSGITPLGYYMHVKRYEGIVTAGYVQELSAPDRVLKKNEIVIEGVILNVGETAAADFVGETVIAYAKESEKEIMTIRSAVSKSETEIVSASDILPKTDANSLYYEKDGKEKHVSVSGTKILYNGLPKAPSATILQPDAGFIKLIYTGGALKSVIIEAYENYMVSRVITSSDTVDVYENRFGTMSVSFADDVAFVLRKSDGTEATIKDVKENDILSVADSSGGKYRKAIVTSNIVTGVVTETSTDSMIIGESEYKIAKSLMGHIGFKMPTIGTEAAFSLDMEGKIAGVNMDANAGMQYGWLKNGEKTKGLNASTQFKIFTTTGEMKVFDTMKSVKVNGKPVAAETLLTGDAPVLMSGSGVAEQLIQYRLNGEKISEINTATDFRNDYSNTMRHSVFSLDAYIKPGYSLDDGTNDWFAFMGGHLKSFGRNWLIREETTIFVIPGSGNEKDYAIKDWSTMTHYSDSSDTYDDLGLYDITEEDHVISVLVWDRRDEGGSILTYPQQNDRIGIVTQNILTEDENGEAMCRITITPEGGGSDNVMVLDELDVLFGEAATDVLKDPIITQRAERPETISAKEIHPGDIVQYVTDHNKKATKISVLFRGQTPPDYEQTSINGNRVETTEKKNYGSRLMSFGTVEKATKYGFLSKVNIKAKGQDKASGVSVKSLMLYTNLMYEFNTKTNTLNVITKDDVEIGDKALYITRTTVPLMIVIYK